MVEEICGCLLDGLALVGHLRQARRELRYRPSAAILYAKFMMEDLPKVEKCLGVSLADVKDPLERVAPVLEERRKFEAERLLDRAEVRLMTKIRRCAGR